MEFSPDYLPRDPNNGCAPVYPHSYIRVNTIFEVVKANSGYTAWSDQHLAYELVNGPSGKGVNDLYNPEINSNVVPLPNIPGCSPLPDTGAGGDWTSSFQNIQCNDTLKVQATLNEIHGKTHDGSSSAPVPAVFGMNFQAVSVGQKLVEAATNTLVRIPADNKALKAPSDVLGGLVAHASEDDVSLLWLKDQTQTGNAVSMLQGNLASTGGGEIFAGPSLSLMFNDPATDSRTPDIIITPDMGVVYTGGMKKISEHGGFANDDTNVMMLVAGVGLPPSINTAPVRTAQVAPTILKALGLNPPTLQAVRIEGTTTLPGLPY